MTTIQPMNTVSQGLDTHLSSSSLAKTKSAPVDKVAVSQAAVLAKKGDAPQADTKQMTDELNKLIEKMGVELSFSVDDDLNMVVVTVSKAGSDEVIRQIPSKEMVELAKRLKEMEARGDAKGVLLGLVS